MPLRDHFRPPLTRKRSWDGLHGMWPAVMVTDLNRRLPARYAAAPSVHLGGTFEVDVGSHEEVSAGGRPRTAPDEGGVATAVWAPPRATIEVATELADQDEYEVRIYDTEEDRRLVAAVEIIAPSNKDRPDSRRLLVAKCAALLREQVSVAIVDVVTTRQFDLYEELLDLVAHANPSPATEAPAIYAAACRWRRIGGAARLQTWACPLILGQALPTLPLWLADELAVPLDLEATYEDACRNLRIA
ncbi:hypothetical protein OJF2_31990 [Aquisphaera giovannonii]|uniref:DUF4058 domain-containing protein n=1 Tax=Aquisphaera giovannonii TaxID=406548 RepID=A0A5B9W282_9BACT|nr:DUF4058 family protein [Aquisphaera giovannonii]QEH34658.1 hypothetical protein OJF2_31990 [Aquisphaera giovannonii]